MANFNIMANKDCLKSTIVYVRVYILKYACKQQGKHA